MVSSLVELGRLETRRRAGVQTFADLCASSSVLVSTLASSAPRRNWQTTRARDDKANKPRSIQQLTIANKQHPTSVQCFPSLPFPSPKPGAPGPPPSQGKDRFCTLTALCPFFGSIGNGPRTGDTWAPYYLVLGRQRLRRGTCRRPKYLAHSSVRRASDARCCKVQGGQTNLWWTPRSVPSKPQQPVTSGQRGVCVRSVPICVEPQPHAQPGPKPKGPRNPPLLLTKHSWMRKILQTCPNTCTPASPPSLPFFLASSRPGQRLRLQP